MILIFKKVIVLLFLELSLILTHNFRLNTLIKNGCNIIQQTKFFSNVNVACDIDTLDPPVISPSPACITEEPNYWVIGGLVVFIVVVIGFVIFSNNNGMPPGNDLSVLNTSPHIQEDISPNILENTFDGDIPPELIEVIINLILKNRLENECSTCDDD